MLHNPKSQLGQDEIVARHFGYKRGGYYADIGAADGVELSNTYALEKELGWTGICIEPNPQFFAALQKNRDCRKDNRCVVPSSYRSAGPLPFKAAGWLGGLYIDGFSDPHVLGTSLEPILVPHAMVSTILREHDAPPIIDYLSLDIEGGEYEILKDPDFWGVYRCTMMTVEHNDYMGPAQVKRRQDLHELLSSKGYSISPLEHDDIYILERPSR